MAYRKFRTFLLQDNSLLVHVPQRPDVRFVQDPHGRLVWSLDYIEKLYGTLAAETIKAQRGDWWGGAECVAVYDAYAQATTQEEAKVSHEYHSFDEVGTYHSLCPECNHPWLRAVKALMVYHFPISTDGKEICDKCNKPGGGDVPWPCDTAYFIRKEVGATFFEILVVEARDGRTRNRPRTRQGNHPSQEDGPVLQQHTGVRPVRESEAGNGAYPVPSGMRTLVVPEMQAGDRPREGGGGGSAPSGAAGAPGGPEERLVRAPEVGVPELGIDVARCAQRRRPSSVEKCGLYLVEMHGWYVCVEHGPRGQI